MSVLDDELKRVEMKVAREWAASGLPPERMEPSIDPLHRLYYFHLWANLIVYQYAETDGAASAEKLFANLPKLLQAIIDCNPKDFTIEEFLALAGTHGVNDEPSRVFAWTGASHVAAIVSAWQVGRIELRRFTNLLTPGHPGETIDLGTIDEFCESYASFLSYHPHWNDGIELVWKDEEGNLFADASGTIPSESNTVALAAKDERVCHAESASIRFLGDRFYRMPSGKTVLATEREDEILQSFIGRGPANTELLIDRSGNARATEVIRKMARDAKFEGMVKTPGVKGAGGYYVNMTCAPGTEKP